MHQPLINYTQPLFRPPSEARSLILQVTNGCSWNNCSFCGMYIEEQKRFHITPLGQIKQQLEEIAAAAIPVQRVFLADGDATTLSTRRLADILSEIKTHLPTVRRISSYCLPRNLKKKPINELQHLQTLGLNLLYVGCESGDNEVLHRVEKGETYQSSLEALQKIKAAGIKSSVMILNGLGGPELSEQHARKSALLMNEAQPEYLSSLVVDVTAGKPDFIERFGGGWRHLSQMELFKEMEILLETLQLKNTIFRSDHASNYLVLKGVLGRDKDKLLDTVRTAINHPDRIALREEWQRGL